MRSVSPQEGDEWPPNYERVGNKPKPLCHCRYGQMTREESLKRETGSPNEEEGELYPRIHLAPNFNETKDSRAGEGSLLENRPLLQNHVVEDKATSRNTQTEIITITTSRTNTRTSRGTSTGQTEWLHGNSPETKKWTWNGVYDKKQKQQEKKFLFCCLNNWKHSESRVQIEKQGPLEQWSARTKTYRDRGRKMAFHKWNNRSPDENNIDQQHTSRNPCLCCRTMSDDVGD